jgi:GMP synthase-like glutamine amidotransferase
VRIHSLHHVSFEGLGTIAAWARDAGHTVTSTWLSGGDRLPDHGAYDALLVMGGPMSVHDEALHPWLADEKRFLRAAVDRGKPVLGICLGGQLLAHVLGARVVEQADLEIGWFPVRRAAGLAASLAAILPDAFDAFHWHGETFELPPGAVQLAVSEACPQQAFACGDQVIGLQFHVETTPEIAAALVEHCPEDLRPGRYVQPAGAILGVASRFESLAITMRHILSRFQAIADRATM